jgi:hypothetical protein
MVGRLIMVAMPILDDPDAVEALQCAGKVADRRCERTVARPIPEEEIAVRGSRPGNYFDFNVDGAIWLAYEGSPGTVTRVYCQEHRSQRTPW